jgi:hypothetical protein
MFKVFKQSAAIVLLGVVQNSLVIWGYYEVARFQHIPFSRGAL